MRYINPLIACAIALSAIACTTVDEQKLAVRNRASFDFACPPEQISVVWLQAGTYGAEGCRAKQVYEAQGTQVYKEGMAPNPVYIDNYGYGPYGGGVGYGFGYGHYYAGHR